MNPQSEPMDSRWFGNNMKYLIKIRESKVYNENEKEILEEYGFSFRIKETVEECQKRMDDDFDRLNMSAIGVSSCMPVASGTYQVIGCPELLQEQAEEMCQKLDIDEYLLNFEEKEIVISLSGFYSKNDNYNDDSCEDCDDWN